jgi:hypothetical protein
MSKADLLAKLIEIIESYKDDKMSEAHMTIEAMKKEISAFESESESDWEQEYEEMKKAFESEGERDWEQEYEEKLREWKNHYTQLTVDIIRKYFWDPVAKKGKPIKFFAVQDIDGETDDWETVTPSGALIIGDIDDNQKIEDWLSTSTDGPYLDDGSNGKTFYYLEFTEDLSYGDDKTVQIGWNGRNPNQVNNYMTLDALDAVDCWMSREWFESHVAQFEKDQKTKGTDAERAKSKREREKAKALAERKVEMMAEGKADVPQWKVMANAAFVRANSSYKAAVALADHFQFEKALELYVQAAKDFAKAESCYREAGDEAGVMLSRDEGSKCQNGIDYYKHAVSC